MFKQKTVNVKTETVEEYLSRGGKIEKFAEGDSYKRKTRKPLTIDAQTLLDNCKNEHEERSLIDFLKTQGIEVQE